MKSNVQGLSPQRSFPGRVGRHALANQGRRALEPGKGRFQRALGAS